MEAMAKLPVTTAPTTELRELAANALGLAVAELDVDSLLHLLQSAARLVHAQRDGGDVPLRLVPGPRAVQ